MKRIFCLLLALMLLSAGQAQTLETGGDAVKFVKLDALPEQGWQKTAAFPDWKGYPDDTLAMNSQISFQGFHGQGAIYLTVDAAVERFTLYVNNTRCDTSGLSGGIWAADISGATVDGVNTLQISGIQPTGLDKPVSVYIPYPVVLEGDGSLEGIRPEALRLVEQIIETDVAHGFTSAQLAVVKNGRMVYENAWGRVNSADPDSPAATPDTLYDLASVTKMFAGNYAIMKLITDGALDVNTPVVDLLGEGFADDTLDFAYQDAEDPGHEAQIAWKRSLTLRHLLCHEAGFPASPRYNDPDFDMSAQDVGQPGANLCYAPTRQDTLPAIFKTPLLYQPGTKTVYSDVDYILVSFIVEALTGQRLDAYVKDTFYAPLGLSHITYLPLENGFAPNDCAATELHGNTRDGHASFPGIRTRTIQGEVHDERAFYCMGGVSGHAGLFASAGDLARLASVMLTGGYGETRFFSRNVMDLFTAPKSAAFGQWGLGWYREGDDQRPWYFGTQASSGAIGHQGWTGTLAMVDPSRSLVIVYLTNKINSPVTDPESNLNKFDGGCYTASSLGFVPQILSIGMDAGADVTAQLDDLAADMAIESLKLIPVGAGADHPCVKNARSKLEILRARADNEDALALPDDLEAALPKE